MWQSFLPWAGCIPVGVLLVVVCFERWRRKCRGERPPLTEKLLRPAGYSLQRKLEDLNDTFNTWFIGTFLFSLLAVGDIVSTPADAVGRIIFLAVFGLAAAGCTVMAWRRLRDIRSYRMGLLGEQAMAEQLQRLLPHGYQVFHDVPGDGKWNIDHVVVGSSGVFAIETKYRTKRRGSAGERDNEAVLTAIKFNTLGYDVKSPKSCQR